MGRMIDGGHGRTMALAAYGLTGGSIVLQALSLSHAALAVIANALGAFAIALFAPTMMTRVYTLAKA